MRATTLKLSIDTKVSIHSQFLITSAPHYCSVAGEAPDYSIVNSESSCWQTSAEKLTRPPSGLVDSHFEICGQQIKVVLASSPSAALSAAFKRLKATACSAAHLPKHPNHPGAGSKTTQLRGRHFSLKSSKVLPAELKRTFLL